MNLKESIERGNRALKESNWEMALHYWSNVYAQAPNHQWAGATLGLTLFRLNCLDEATQYLLDDIEMYPNREVAFVYLARISQAQDNWELNVQQWAIIQSRFPDYEWALQSYANALKKIGELNKAERYFHMDVAKYPQHAWWSFTRLIEIAIEKQQFKLAKQRLGIFIEWFPEAEDVQYKYKTLIQTAQQQHTNVLQPTSYMVCFTSAKQQQYMGMTMPKVASTTLVARLYRQMTHKKPPRNRDHRILMQDFEDTQAYDPISNDYFTFTIVRNPYTRILSAYLDKIQKPKRAPKFRPPLRFGLPDVEKVSFYDFLRRLWEMPVEGLDPHFQPQWLILSLHKSITYDYVGRFEYLEDDLQALLRHIGYDKFKGVNQVSRRPHATNAGEKLRQYYGEEEQTLVAEIYEDDFKYLGYGYDLDLA
jgi:tetratricopeptide (TPR) repeat protein